MFEMIFEADAPSEVGSCGGNSLSRRHAGDRSPGARRVGPPYGADSTARLCVHSSTHSVHPQ